VFRSRARCSLILALVLSACVPVQAARAAERDNAKRARSLLSDGFNFVKHALGLVRDTAVVSHAVSLSPREAAVELELLDGTTRVVSLRSGQVLVDGVAVGKFKPGGALDRAWRQLLAGAAAKDTRELLAALRAFRVSGLTAEDQVAGRNLATAFRNLTIESTPLGASSSATAQLAAAAASTIAVHLADSVARVLTVADVASLDTLTRQLTGLSGIGPDLAGSVRNSPLHIGHTTVRADQRLEGSLVVFRGNADIYGTVSGNVVALLGDVICHDGGAIEGNAVSVGGRVVEAGGSVAGDIKTLSAAGLVATAGAQPGERTSALQQLFRDVGTVVAVFIALAMVGSGLVFFGRRYVEVVADTTTHAFGRSFVVGLLGQLLLLPVFAMMIVGLVLTIVGILVLPLAVPAFVLGVALAALGGYLAVAHAVGETVTRRRMANGAFVRSPNSYGYILNGLFGLLGLWAAAALFGWLGPVVLLLRITAALVTWMAMTTGFGAVLLSRAGLRETFAGRYSGEMTDEYLWATPPATPTADRMGRTS
jgi:hypothetical protein